MKPDAELLLRKHHLYRTATRERILGLLLRHRSPMTIREIADALSSPAPDLATVHRTMRSFLEHGIVVALTIEDSRKFILNTDDSHRHLSYCLSCGTTEGVRQAGCSLEREGACLAKGGFHAIGHSVVYYGYCAHCVKANKHACKEVQ
ncbi:MAG: transcriptional repressor [Candidatus Brocadiia bacterium]